MGLRGVNPEGLVWTSHVPQQRSVIEHNVVWIAGIAVLALVAFLIDRFPPQSRGTNEHKQIAFNAPQDNANLRDEPTKSTVPATSTQPPAITGNSGPPASAPVNGAVGAKGLIAKDAAREIAPIDFPPMEPEMAFDPLTGSLQSGAGGSTARIDTPTPSVKPEKPATAPPMPDTPSSVAANTNKPKSSPIAADDSADPAPEISISDGGEVPIPYITLEAAVADAKDGGTVELKFNGVRAVSEKPFRISGKRVTIRAGAAITR